MQHVSSEDIENGPRVADVQKHLTDPLTSRKPDRGAWIGEGEDEVDYQ